MSVLQFGRIWDSQAEVNRAKKSADMLGWSVGKNGTFHLIIVVGDVAIPACKESLSVSGQVEEWVPCGHPCKTCDRIATARGYKGRA